MKSENTKLSDSDVNPQSTDILSYSGLNDVSTPSLSLSDLIGESRWDTKATPQPDLPFSGMYKLPDFKTYKSLPLGRLLYIDN